MSNPVPLRLRLKTPRGELAGQARNVERFRMTFELSAPLRPGDAVDFELDLAPQAEVGDSLARGTLRVLRVIDAHPGAPSLFSAEIVELRREDVGVYEGWLRRAASREASRFPATGRLGEAHVDITDDTLTQPTDAGDTAMLRSAVLPHRLGAAPGSSAEWGFSSEDGRSALHLAGREAIRAALRHGLEARSDGRSLPPRRSTAWMDRTRAQALQTAGQWCPTTDAPVELTPLQAEDQPDPCIEVDPDQTPVMVRVHWRSSAAYREDWLQHLQQGALFLMTTEPLPAERRLQVVLALPGGQQLTCPGQVVAPMPTGCGVSLLLAPDQRSALSEAARTAT